MRRDPVYVLDHDEKWILHGKGEHCEQAVRSSRVMGYHLVCLASLTPNPITPRPPIHPHDSLPKSCSLVRPPSLRRRRKGHDRASSLTRPERRIARHDGSRRGGTERRSPCEAGCRIAGRDHARAAGLADGVGHGSGMGGCDEESQCCRGGEDVDCAGEPHCAVSSWVWMIGRYACFALSLLEVRQSGVLLSLLLACCVVSKGLSAV